jgi:hypothetical protein
MDDFRVTFRRTSPLLSFFKIFSVIFLVGYIIFNPSAAAEVFKTVLGTLLDAAVAIGSFLVGLVS